jgi:hypothetical protein
MAKYKNIVGTGFPDYVKEQLKARQTLVSQPNRNSTALQFLTNRNSFVRLSSGVLTKDNQNGYTDTLAKNNVLQGGLVTVNNNVATFNKRYSIGATDNLGFKPNPGIINLSVGTGGRWQTLMQADIEFVCYDLDQLDIMSELYMSLGCHVFLEWGHIPYIDNTGKLTNNVNTLNFFGNEFAKQEQIIKKIAQLRKNSKGNYDALLGRVYNFDFNANTDGTYTCKIQVMGPGQMIESININAFSNLNLSNEENTLIDSTKYSSSLINALRGIQKTLEISSQDLLKKEEKNPNNIGTDPTTAGGSSFEFASSLRAEDLNNKLAVVNTKSYYDTLDKIYSNCTYPGPKFISPDGTEINRVIIYAEDGFPRYGNAHQIVSGIADNNDNLSSIPLEFYKGYVTLLPTNLQTEESFLGTYITLGHLMTLIQHIGIFVESPTNNSESPNSSNSTPVIRIDYHPDNTIINRGPLEASIDPKICLIPLAVAQRTLQNVSAPLNGAAAFKQFLKPLDTNSTDNKYPTGDNVEKTNEAKNLFLNTRLNKVNAVLGNNGFEGKLFNILINIEFAINTLENLSSSKEETTEVNLSEYLNSILDGINLSLGQVNNFRIFFDDNSQCIRIIDETAVENNLKDNNILEIPNYGTNSTTYDYTFQSKIGPNLAKQIVIASQASNSDGLQEFSEDVLTYRKLNDDVEDRFAKKISKGIPSTENDDPPNLKSLQYFFNSIYSIYSSNTDNKLSTTSLLSIKNIYKELQNTQKKFLKQPYGNILIPLEYSITIDGISGVLPYNAFKVPDNRLPKKYKNKVAFAVFSINHNFENNQWTTTLRGQTILTDKASIEERGGGGASASF